MTEEGKAGALIEQAETLGFGLEYDSGFVVVRRPAPADRRRDDAAEARKMLIEQLCKHASEVHELLIAAARRRRSVDFHGRQLFFSDFQLLAKLDGFNENGLAAISYCETNRDQRVIERTGSCRADEMAIIEIYEEADRVPSTISPWSTDEKTRELLERAESAGLRFRHDLGFLVLEWPGAATEGEQRDVASAAIRQLGRRMHQVFSLCVGRARAIRGRDFVGQQAFATEFGAAGTLVSCDDDGSVTLLSSEDDPTGPGMRRQWKGESLLVVVGENEPDRASSADPNFEPARGSWFRRAFGG